MSNLMLIIKYLPHSNHLQTSAVFFLPSYQDEVDQATSIEELEKQIEKLAKVHSCRMSMWYNESNHCNHKCLRRQRNYACLAVGNNV